MLISIMGPEKEKERRKKLQLISIDDIQEICRAF